MPTALPYFLYSLGILVREGSEALLVIVALLAAVREAGQERRARDIYAGALLAVGLSLVLAWAVNHLIADDTSDTLEGVFQLLAAATLFYVSSWLTARSQSDRWRTFLHNKVEASRDVAGPSIALGLTAFLAVMREGAETIVFFQALLGGATETVERHAVMAGLLAGAVALGVIFLVLRKAAFRIPLGSFFTATSVLLYATGGDFRRPGNRELSGIGRDARDFRRSCADDPGAGALPHRADAGGAGRDAGLAALALFAPAGPRKRKRGDAPAGAAVRSVPRRVAAPFAGSLSALLPAHRENCTQLFLRNACDAAIAMIQPRE